MKEHKESEEKRSRKEEKENHHHHLSPEPFAIDAVDKSLLREAWAHGIVRKDVKEAAEDMSISAAEVNDWLNYMHDVKWRLNTDNPVTWRNFRRSLRMWHKIEERIKARRERRGGSAEREAEKRKAAEVERMRKMYEDSKKPASWTLCNERCAFAEVCGCAKKHLIPPQLRSYPIPPQDCDGFEPKEVA